MKRSDALRLGDEFADAIQRLVDRPREKGHDFETRRQTATALAHFGNPQQRLRVIQVAGTSGKGSVVTLLSAMLQAHGFSVGTQVSPHIYDIRERCQINGQLIDPELFVELFEQIRPYLQTAEGEQLSTYQPVFILANLLFAATKVDYAVIETFCGGRDDATNQYDSPETLAVLTRLGLDHLVSLGPTLRDIAGHKAGIISHHGRAVAWHSDSVSAAVITAEAHYKKAELNWVNAPDPMLPALTGHQAENATVALRALEVLAERDGFQIDRVAAYKAAADLQLPGRYETVQWHDREIIFDAAHNPQKMGALVSQLKHTPDKPTVALVAFKSCKDYGQMLQLLVPHTTAVVATSIFTDYPQLADRSMSPDVIAAAAAAQGAADVVTAANPATALQQALMLSQPGGRIVVTGSLYLLCEVRAALRELSEDQVSVQG